MGKSTEINYTKIERAIALLNQIYIKLDVDFVYKINEKGINTEKDKYSLPNIRKKVDYSIKGHFAVYNNYILDKNQNIFIHKSDESACTMVEMNTDNQKVKQFAINYTDSNGKVQQKNINVIVPSGRTSTKTTTLESITTINNFLGTLSENCNTYEENMNKYITQINNLKQEIKIEIQKLEEIRDKYKETDTPEDNITGSIVAIPTASTLVSRIRKNLENGNIKQANKNYQKLKDLKGNKWAKQRINKMINNLGLNVKISNGKIVSIIPKKVDPTDTGATTVPPATVVTVAATPFLQMQKDNDFIEEEALGKYKKTLIYEEYSKRISKIDPNDPNAEKQIEILREEMEEKLDEIDKQVLNNKEKIESEYSNGVRTQQYTDEYVAKGREISLSGLSDKEETLIKSINSNEEVIENKLKEIHNSSSINTTPVTPNQPNDSVATQEPTPQPSQPQNQTPSPAPQPQQNTPSQQPNNNVNYVNRGSNSANTVTTQTETTSGTSATPEVPSDTETLGNTEESNLDSILGIEKEDGVSNNNVIIDDVPTPTKEKSSGMSGVIPAVLGVGAVGAAAVAGVRYVKNKKQTEDIDDSYDDENNNVYVESNNNEYMKDDYLGPAGSEYTDTSSYESAPNDIVPNDDNYTDAESLEDDSDDDFSNDIAYNSIV